jgi:integrase
LLSRSDDVTLTDADVRNAKPRKRPYALTDRDGVELLVSAKTKRWRYRYWFNGKQHRKTFGRYPDMSLRGAHKTAAKFRTLLYTGVDPFASNGHAVDSDVLLADVVARFVDERSVEWKSTTAGTYRAAIKSFVDWARAARVRSVSQLDATALAKYRAHAIATPCRVTSRGAPKNQRKSASGVNCQLRAVAAMLQVLRKSGQLSPALTSDAIKDNLKQLPVQHIRPDSLKPAQLRALLVACRKHDATSRAQPIAALVVTMLLSGMRLGETRRLTWSDVDFDELTLRVVAGKTGRERLVDLKVSPALVKLLKSMHRRRTGALVFELTRHAITHGRRRLIDEYGAPSFLWSQRHSRSGSRSVPTLRSTCESYLANAPKILIFGASSARRVADQLGHSVQIAERHYLGTMRHIPTNAKTLEAAMEIERELRSLTRG